MTDTEGAKAPPGGETTDKAKGDNPAGLGIKTAGLIKVEYQGMKMSHNKNETIEERVQGVRDFKFKDGDVLLDVYPKCGTHWVIRILHMLVNKTATYDPGVTFDSFFLDLQRFDLLSDLDPPRVFATHYPFDMLPEDLKNGRTKVVHVYRNPKAAFVSNHHMVQSILKTVQGRQNFEENTIDKRCQDYLQEKEMYGGWFSHMTKVLEYKKANPHVPVFHLAYEDLLQDTSGCIKRLSDYLGLNVSDSLCSDIAHAVSFTRQKQQEEQITEKGTITHVCGIYRKGEADDWKNVLTVAQNEQFDDKLQQHAHLSPMFARYVTNYNNNP